MPAVTAVMTVMGQSASRRCHPGATATRGWSVSRPTPSHPATMRAATLALHRPPCLCPQTSLSVPDRTPQSVARAPVAAATYHHHSSLTPHFHLACTARRSTLYPARRLRVAAWLARTAPDVHLHHPRSLLAR